MQATLGDRAVQQMRAEAQRKAVERASAADPTDVNQVPLGQRVPEPAPEPEPALEPIPDVEWWDARWATLHMYICPSSDLKRYPN